MKIHQIAAQVYTVREFLKTPSDIARSFKKLREIGYQAVQISGLGPISDDELVAILDGEGLTCCATHEAPADILERPEQVVEKLEKLNCKFTAYPYPSEVDLSDLESVKKLAIRLEHAGSILADAGRGLSYHNHALEFVKIDGRPALDHLFAWTNPSVLQAEIDTYWVQVGGGNPAVWCRKLSGRLSIIHLKDCGVREGNETAWMEIGEGNLDFPAIVQAAEEGGCQWYAVEQDSCPGNPFDSLRISFEYIRDHLIES